MTTVKQNIHKVILEYTVPIVPRLPFSIYRQAISPLANIESNNWKTLHHLKDVYSDTVSVWARVFQTSRQIPKNRGNTELNHI